MLAYLVLQILGPSMLPPVLALALHNDAIIVHLVGCQAGALSEQLRPRATLWGYELTPRCSARFWRCVFIDGRSSFTKRP